MSLMKSEVQPLRSATEPTGGESKTEPSSQLSVTVVEPQRAVETWPIFKPLVERALAHGLGEETTSNEVLGLVTSGEAQMWAISRDQELLGVTVLSVKQTSTMRKLYVELLAGQQMADWVDEVEQLMLDFRDSIGADCLEASCRPGLAKRLAGRGWRKKAITMELV